MCYLKDPLHLQLLHFLQLLRHDVLLLLHSPVHLTYFLFVIHFLYPKLRISNRTVYLDNRHWILQDKRHLHLQEFLQHNFYRLLLISSGNSYYIQELPMERFLQGRAAYLPDPDYWITVLSEDLLLSLINLYLPLHLCQGLLPIQLLQFR